MSTTSAPLDSKLGQLMSTTSAQIDLWRQSPTESQILEFKEAKAQLNSNKLYKYCVAIANEGGGKLILGVADIPPRPIVGTHAFRNPIATMEKVYQKVKFRVDIEEVQHPAGRILVFHIPSRPSGTAYHYDEIYLMRVGQELRPMSEDRLRQIFTEGSPSWLEQPTKTNLSAQDVIELLDTQTYFELLRLPYPTSQDGVLQQLSNDRLIDRRQTGFSILRLGGLLLARRLEDFADLARKAPRVIVYTGESKQETRLDHTTIKGFAVGYHALVEFVMSQLPQNEVIEAAIRREVKLLPEATVRELLANALIRRP